MTFRLTRLAASLLVLIFAFSAYSQRQDYALLFTADKYENFDDLETIADTQEIASILESKYGFQVEVVENYTNTVVMQKIREYFGKTYGKNDQLLIYFVGHGYFDSVFKQGYITCSNSSPDDANFESYIEFGVIKNLLNRVPCEHIMLALNTDYARYFDPEMVGDHWVNDPVQIETEDSDIPDNLVAQKLERRTRLFVANGSDRMDNEAYESFHGLMMNILNSNGGEDGIVDVTEMTHMMKQLLPVPRAGGFGADVPGSDFLFIVK